MRPRTTLAAFAVAVAVFAPSLAAQVVRPPDSLKRTHLPSDSADFPAKVRTGGMGALCQTGCPSDGGYPAVARAALVKAAETDFTIRYEVAFDHEWGDPPGRRTGLPVLRLEYDATKCGGSE